MQVTDFRITASRSKIRQCLQSGANAIHIKPAFATSVVFAILLRILLVLAFTV